MEVAIIRPGPIQGHLMHPYLERRKQVMEHGVDPETLPCYDERLRSILRRTLGVPLFQEQMLKMAMVMADFSGAEAEELRRALSFHRSQERMQKVERKLREAMERKGVSQEVIEGIVQAVGSFALYGFPESHAISFAHLAYASAYLKAHRASEFYASLLNNQPMGFYSSASLVKDGQRHGVKFLPVCVMRSEWDCTVGEPSVSASSGKSLTVDCEGESTELESSLNRLAGKPVLRQFPVRLGLRVLRGLSRSGAEQLLAERRRAPFTSLDDCKRRVPLSKEDWRVLAEAGALNCFVAHRRDALWQVEKQWRQGDLFEDYAASERTFASDSSHSSQQSSTRVLSSEMTENLLSRPSGTLSSIPNGGEGRGEEVLGPANKGSADSNPFEAADSSRKFMSQSDDRTQDTASPLAPMDYAERIHADYRSMHLTTGKHPMALLRSRLKGVLRAADLPGVPHGKAVRIAGNVICRQRPGTAKGFVFISLEDETGISNAVVTPPMFEANRLIITEESFLMITGRLQNIDNVIHVKAQRIERLNCDPVVASASYDFH